MGRCGEIRTTRPRQSPPSGAATKEGTARRGTGRAAPSGSGPWPPRPSRPATSKNHTGNSASGSPSRRQAPRYRPPLLVEDPVGHQVAQGHVEDAPHLGRIGGQPGGRSRAATTGVITVLDATVGMGVSSPITVASDGSRPPPRPPHAGRPPRRSRAASSRPPGKATSPRWDRRRSDRTVRTTRARPSSSNRATSTAAGLPPRHPSGQSPPRLVGPTTGPVPPVVVQGLPDPIEGQRRPCPADQPRPRGRRPGPVGGGRGIDRSEVVGTVAGPWRPQVRPGPGSVTGGWGDPGGTAGGPRSNSSMTYIYSMASDTDPAALPGRLLPAWRPDCPGPAYPRGPGPAPAPETPIGRPRRTGRSTHGVGRVGTSGSRRAGV